MRRQYTPIFREFTTSSMWAQSCEVRCVWIWMLLNADPEGFVPGTIPGLAIAANVPVDATRAAIALFMAPDPDSNTQSDEGRRLEKVPHGWRILNFEYWRRLAQLEAEKARKRKWAAKQGKPANDPENDNATEPTSERPQASNLDASSETLDAPKPKPKPKPSLSEEGSPLPPARCPKCQNIMARVGDEVGCLLCPDQTFAAPTLPAVIRKLSEWRPKEGELEGLRDAAKLAGVKDFDRWFAQLGSGPIGGARGVLPDMVGDYLHGQFARWRQWEETDALRDANSRAAAAAPRSFRGEPLPPQGPQRERVQGAPEWVYVEHAQFARQHAMKLGPAAKEFAESYHLGDPSTLKPADVFGPFMKFLQDRANRKESA
ncbi:MAG TPA: hypothetical protein VFM95_02710 [Microcella sp.]|nr:hypothetical protein [Microcella sp.]